MVTVGFVKGGQAANVIPETVELKGTFRSMTLEGIHYLQQRIKEVLFILRSDILIPLQICGLRNVNPVCCIARLYTYPED